MKSVYGTVRAFFNQTHLNFWFPLILAAFFCPGISSAQGFVNLGFEITTLNPILVNELSGFYSTNATVPGWTWSPPFNATGVNPYTEVSLNGLALDAPAVTLHNTNSLFAQPLLGRYSILLQGGTYSGGLVVGTNGASIFQIGQIPITAESLIYRGWSNIKVSFNGQILAPIALMDIANYSVWGIDVSAYAGQTGELRFTAPWQTTSMLDGIQFSSSSVPEPSSVTLIASGLIVVLLSLKRFRAFFKYLE